MLNSKKTKKTKNDQVLYRETGCEAEERWGKRDLDQIFG
jgi:hypothetical protein